MHSLWTNFSQPWACFVGCFNKTRKRGKQSQSFACLSSAKFWKLIFRIFDGTSGSSTESWSLVVFRQFRTWCLFSSRLSRSWIVMIDFLKMHFLTPWNWGFKFYYQRYLVHTSLVSQCCLISFRFAVQKVWLCGLQMDSWSSKILLCSLFWAWLLQVGHVRFDWSDCEQDFTYLASH